MTTQGGVLVRHQPPMTLADAVPAFGRDRSAAWVRAVLLVIGGAALTALAAQLSWQSPWSPVPYTGQTAAVLLVGTALGWRLGLASMALYVLVGVAGLPVYAGQAHGIETLLGYSGGYLIGFMVAAALVGRLAERGWDRSPLRAIGLMVIGNLVIYAIGVPVLAITLEMAPGDALQAGALDFALWDAFKIVIAAGLLPLAWRAIGPGGARH